VVGDIGYGGCLLTLQNPLEPGALVTVEIDDNLAQPAVAEVRWCKRRGRNYEAGLQFDHEHLVPPQHDLLAHAQA